MRSVVDEPALDLEALLEPPEHGVERLDQPRDLVTRSRMRQAVAEVGLTDASSPHHHRVDRPERLSSKQRAGQPDSGEDQQRHAQEEPSTGAQHRVCIVQRHGHLDRVPRGADGDREGHHPNRFLELGNRAEHRLAVAQPREERRRGRQAGGAEGRAPPEDPAVQVGDLDELVQSHERGEPSAGRDLVDADRLPGICLDRRRLRRGERQDRVVDDLPQNHAAERPVRAERRDRQHHRQHRDVPQPEPGLEAERPHGSAESGGPNR